ncbi:MAG: hypothetical protein OXH00_14980 [Candidatus Poribacteria bacterium]|nr:hypothetical protein [Candidatus Poribacteria bacterium]
MSVLSVVPYFGEYVTTWSISNGGGFPQEVVYEDKSLFKAAGPRLASDVINEIKDAFA